MRGILIVVLPAEPEDYAPGFPYAETLNDLLYEFDMANLSNQVWVPLSPAQLAKEEAWYNNPENVITVIDPTGKKSHDRTLATELYSSFHEYLIDRHIDYLVDTKEYGYYNNPKGKHTGYMVGGRFNPVFMVKDGKKLEPSSIAPLALIDIDATIKLNNRNYERYPDALLMDGIWEDLDLDEDLTFVGNWKALFAMFPPSSYLIAVDYHY